ncbi:hypothetical protein VaNZ11_011667, partial [Volvox africanus]
PPPLFPGRVSLQPYISQYQPKQPLPRPPTPLSPQRLQPSLALNEGTAMPQVGSQQTPSQSAQDLLHPPPSKTQNRRAPSNAVLDHVFLLAYPIFKGSSPYSSCSVGVQAQLAATLANVLGLPLRNVTTDCDTSGGGSRSGRGSGSTDAAVNHRRRLYQLDSAECADEDPNASNVSLLVTADPLKDLSDLRSEVLTALTMLDGFCGLTPVNGDWVVIGSKFRGKPVTPIASNNLASNTGGKYGNKTAAGTGTGNSSSGASQSKMLGPVIIAIAVVGCVLMLCVLKIALFLYHRRRVGPAGKIDGVSSEPSWLTDSAKPATATISETEGSSHPTNRESLLEGTNYEPLSGSANTTDRPTVAAVEWAGLADSMQAVNVLTAATPSATATPVEATRSPTTAVRSTSQISAPLVGSIPGNSTRSSLRWRDSQVLPYQVQEAQAEEAAVGRFLLDSDVNVDGDDDEEVFRGSSGDGNQLLISATAISVHESRLLSSASTIALALPMCWNPLWFETSGSGATPPVTQAAPPAAARVGADAPVGAEYAGCSLTQRALRPVMEKGAAGETTANVSSSWARLPAIACRPAELAKNHATDGDSPSALRALFKINTTPASSPRSHDLTSSTGWWNPLWQAQAAALPGEATLTSLAVPDDVACGRATDTDPTAHTSHAAAAEDYPRSSLTPRAFFPAAVQGGTPAAIVTRAETAVVPKAQQVPTAGGPCIPAAVEAGGRKSQSLGAIGLSKAAAAIFSPDVETTSPRWWNAPWLRQVEAVPRTPALATGPYNSAPAARSPVSPGAANLGLTIMNNPLAEDGEMG